MSKRALWVAVLLAGAATCGYADTYNLTADFSYNGKDDTASGSFTYNGTTASLISFTVTGALNNYSAVGMITSTTYNPGSWNAQTKEELSFYNAGFTDFADFFLPVALTGSGDPTITLQTISVDCPGCGVLTSGTITDVSDPPTVAPEPSTALLMTIGLFGAFLVRRRLIQNA